MQAYMYIILCGNGKYYTGSNRFLDNRMSKHLNGIGAKFTRKHLPIKLVYYEVFDRIENAFIREKQIQKWSHAKKKALVEGDDNSLSFLGKKKF